MSKNLGAIVRTRNQAVLLEEGSDNDGPGSLLEGALANRTGCGNADNRSRLKHTGKRLRCQQVYVYIVFCIPLLKQPRTWQPREREPGRIMLK